MPEVNNVGASDSLFDYFNNLSDNNRRKAQTWPFQTVLLMLSPDVLSAITAKEIGHHPNSKKLAVYSNFLDNVKQALKSSRLVESAIVCYIDICRAGASMEKMSGSALRSIVPEFENDLKVQHSDHKS